MTDSAIGKAYLAECIRRLDACIARIKHCVEQLNDEQVWWRPHESMNSVANVLLHLCGNLTQWIIDGVQQKPDMRNRPEEFSARGSISKTELLGRLENVVAQAKKVLAEIPKGDLLQPRRIQGFEETVLSAVSDSLAHLAGHTQEIVYMTRLLLKDEYRFAWVPTTPEQGA